MSMYKIYLITKWQENLKVVEKAFVFSNETAQVIKDSFGPTGLDTLVCRTSGALLLTNDGFQIIKSLSSASPVGKLIFQGLDLFYKKIGDFSKKFILLTREMLGEILNVLSLDETTSSEQILCILQRMNGLLYSLPIVLDKLQTTGIVSECTGGIGDVKNSVISIMKTSINGKFTPKTHEVLVTLLQELLFANEISNDTGHLKQRTMKLLDSFSEIVWEIPGKPLGASMILPGILIPREFLTMVKKLPCSSATTSFKFVILGSSLGYDLPQSSTVLSLKDSQQVNSFLEWRSAYIEKVVKRLAKYDVELVITSATLHETFVHICNQYHMAAIHLIPPEDITRISNACGISPMYELDGDLSLFIGEATSCRSIQVGRHVYAYLETTEALVKQVLLYAPTEVLCHQYSIALQNMLRTLRNSFQEHSDNVLSVVPGGGAFELALVLALEEYRKLNMGNPKISLACQIIEKSLLSIPRQLAKNLDCRLSFFHLQARTRQALNERGDVLGLNRNGGAWFTKD